jgi:hypothetical protein
VPSVKKRRLSWFTKAKNRFSDLLDRKSFSIVTKLFHQVFDFVPEMILTQPVKNYRATLSGFAVSVHFDDIGLPSGFLLTKPQKICKLKIVSSLSKVLCHPEMVENSMRLNPMMPSFVNMFR